MMGDNRGASDDCRFWGPVPKWVIGGAFATVLAAEAHRPPVAAAFGRSVRAARSARAAASWPA